MYQAKNDLPQALQFLRFYKQSLQRVDNSVPIKHRVETSPGFYRRHLEKIDTKLVLSYMTQQVDLTIQWLHHLNTVLPEHILKEMDNLIGEQIKRFHSSCSTSIQNNQDPGFVKVVMPTTSKKEDARYQIERSGDYVMCYIKSVSLKFVEKKHTAALPTFTWIMLIPLTISLITLCAVFSILGFLKTQEQTTNLITSEHHLEPNLAFLKQMNQDYHASFSLSEEEIRCIDDKGATVYDDTSNTGTMCVINHIVKGNKITKKASFSRDYRTLFHHIPCVDSGKNTLSQMVDEFCRSLFI